MYLDVYIGDLDDPSFSWDGGNWEGNAPHRESPFFPSGREAFWRLMRKIDSGELPGKQVDWGAWVARVTRREIEAFIKECYGAARLYQERGEVLGHLYDQLQELRRYVASLEDGKEYALVASEL